MKLIFSLLALVISTTAFAADAWQTVDAARVPDYQRATQQAVDAHQWTCVAKITEAANGAVSDWNVTLPGAINDYIGQATIIKVRSTTQPILMFQVPRDTNGAMYVSTDAARKAVTHVEYSRVDTKTETRNVGTIDNPVFEEQTIVVRTYRASCN